MTELSKEIEATAAELKRLLDAFLDGLGVVHSDEAYRREHELRQFLWDNKGGILAALSSLSPAPADRAEIVEECAKVADDYAGSRKVLNARGWYCDFTAKTIAAAIRSIASEARQKGERE